MEAGHRPQTCEQGQGQLPEERTEKDQYGFFASWPGLVALASSPPPNTGEASSRMEGGSSPSWTFVACGCLVAGGLRAADAEFFNKGVRGRGINRKPHDLVVVLDLGVARLQVDQERRGRIDRHGLWPMGTLLPGLGCLHSRRPRSSRKEPHDPPLQECGVPGRSGAALHVLRCSRLQGSCRPGGLRPCICAGLGPHTSRTSLHSTVTDFLLLLLRGTEAFYSKDVASSAEANSRARCTEGLRPGF